MTGPNLTTAARGPAAGGTVTRKREGGGATGTAGLPPNGTPHLSHSRINRYLHCPEQYRLYYVEGLRPRYPSASLVFGQIVHQALAALFQNGEDPVAVFQRTWQATREVKLTYGQRDSWEKLSKAGEALLAKFVEEELPRLTNVTASEKDFTLDITSLDLPFVGIIDLVADLDRKRTVVDFKTSASAYKDHEALMSDQLTAYGLAEPEAAQAALCVLVKSSNPQIEWHITRGTSDRLSEYLTKVQMVEGNIAARRFYKRSGMWCGWCDFLPVCLGDQEKIRQTLIHVK